MNRFLRLLIPAAALAILSGCAKEKTSTTGELAQEYIEMYMHVKYPGVTADEWGNYILKQEDGTGAEWDSSLPYSSLRTTIRSLDGSIISSTEADIAKQLDEESYKPYNYYGPRYQATGNGSGYAGVEYLLKGMKIGGSKTAVIPSWLLTTSRYNSKAEYLANCSGDTHLIYSITLEGQCEDIAKEEISLLREYVTTFFGAEQASCNYKSGQTDGTFYFVSDTTAFKEEDKRASDATLYIKFTGRRLDGTAFDTNDEESALMEGLYVEGKTYSNSKIVFSSTYTSISMGGSTSLIDGFQGALSKMNWVGQTAVALFVSELGYGSTGTGEVIPPYCPLIFELELLDE